MLLGWLEFKHNAESCEVHMRQSNCCVCDLIFQTLTVYDLDREKDREEIEEILFPSWWCMQKHN